MKYKVGDKVRIVSEWTEKNKGINKEGKMNKWLGKVMTIRRVREIFPSIRAYFMEEDIKENGGGWAWSEDEIAGLATECSQKIVITSDGKETLARLYDGKKVVKSATARCSAGDTFDFSVGAKLAYDRLMSNNHIVEDTKDTENTEWRVIRRPVKSGDYIRIIKKDFSFDEVGDILKVDSISESYARVYGRDHKRPTPSDDMLWLYSPEEFEVVKPVKKKAEEKKVKKEKFVPHIRDGEAHYGNLGDPTNYKDAIGRPLFVGDMVEMFDKDNDSHGETPIVRRKIEWGERRNKAFVMGIEADCDDEKGTIGEWKIIKKRSFEDVNDGETVYCGLKYIKTEP